MQACRPEVKRCPESQCGYWGTELGCEAHGIHSCEVGAKQSHRQLPAKRMGGGGGEFATTESLPVRWDGSSLASATAF